MWGQAQARLAQSLCVRTSSSVLARLSQATKLVDHSVGPGFVRVSAVLLVASSQSHPRRIVPISGSDAVSSLTRVCELLIGHRADTLSPGSRWAVLASSVVGLLHYCMFGCSPTTARVVKLGRLVLVRVSLLVAHSVAACCGFRRHGFRSRPELEDGSTHTSWSRSGSLLLAWRSPAPQLCAIG